MQKSDTVLPVGSLAVTLCPSFQVDVQTLIEPNAISAALEDKANATHPILDGMGDGIDGKDANKRLFPFGSFFPKFEEMSCFEREV